MVRTLKLGGKDGCQQYASRRGADFSLHLVSVDGGMLTGPGQAMCLPDTWLLPIRTTWSEEGIPQRKGKQKGAWVCEKECGANRNNSYHGLLYKLRVRVKRDV